MNGSLVSILYKQMPFYTGFQGYAVDIAHVVVLWVLAPYRIVYGHWRFGEICFFLLECDEIA
jgi:hypothetical protein